MLLCRNQVQVDVVLSPAVVWMGVKEIIAQIAAHLLFPMAHSLPAAELTRGECCALLGCCALLQTLGSGLATGPAVWAAGVSVIQFCSWLLPTGASSVSPLGMDFFFFFLILVYAWGCVLFGISVVPLCLSPCT